MTDSRRAWIWVEKADSPKLMVVDELIDATLLKSSDAELVCRRANEKFGSYRWNPVPARVAGQFVVQGEQRVGSSA